MATDVDGPFPELVLPAGATITVDTGDAAAVITEMNVYGASEVESDTDTTPAVPPLFAYSNESPGLSR